MSESTIDKAVKLYLKDAKKVREDAGFGGLHNDGGAGRMEAQVHAYTCGRKGIVPDFLKSYIKEVEKLKDPDYSEYLRLHKKFSNE